MEFKGFYHSIVFLFLIFSRVDSTHNKTESYSIGFEGFNSVGPSNHTSFGQQNSIVYESRNNPYYTTPPPKQHPITTIKSVKSKTTILPVTVTKVPSKVKITKSPSIRVTSFKPSPTRRPSSTRSPKPKATHPTTKRPTVPTLPPSIYVKPNISKVILPPLNSDMWIQRSPFPTQEVPTTIGPILNSSNWDFTLFYHHLQNFTAKAEHTKQPVYRPNKGDTFTYYYDISHHYKNAHKVAKHYRVLVSNIKNCMTNTSKIMCLPNTNALCLTNGTIMCVTHLSAAISCGVATTKYCAITYQPCDAKHRSCGGNDKLYVGVPCVSKVLLVPSTNDFYQQITLSSIEYCVTSVIQPKRLYSAVGPLFSILLNGAKTQYETLNDNVIRYNNVMF